MIVLESGLKERIYILVYRLLGLLKVLHDSIDQDQTVPTKTLRRQCLVFIFSQKKLQIILAKHSYKL